MLTSFRRIGLLARVVVFAVLVGGAQHKIIAGDATEWDGVTRVSVSESFPDDPQEKPTIQATVIYDNFGPGNSYQTNIGWTVSEVGSTVGRNIDVGCMFTVSGANYSLDTIEVAAGLVRGANELEVWLMDDNGGEPGSVLETITVSGQMGSLGNANPPVVANSNGTPLNDGETYWVVLSVPDTTTHAAWNKNNTNDVGFFVTRTNLGPWNAFNAERGAFRICVNPAGACPMQAIVDELKSHVDVFLADANAPASIPQQIQQGLTAVGHHNLLNDLRGFRDRVLTASPSGKELAGL